MKRTTWIAVFLAAAMILALGALAISLTLQYKDDLFSEENELESNADAALQALYRTEHQTETVPAASEDEGGESGAGETALFVIWVGDSRTLGMEEALSGGDLYIGASGEGYQWLSGTGLGQMEAALEEHPDAPVVFNFGVNDPDNLKLYLALYEDIVGNHPDTHFYFMSVNPIEPTLCENVTNEEIAAFNSGLREAFPDAYLDTFTYMQMMSVVPIDGIHYSDEDYQLLYEYVLQELITREEG